MKKLEDVFTKEDLEEIFKFSKAASNALKGVRRGVEVEFKCPICGEKAHAGVCTNNGHRHTKCGACGRAFIE